MYPPLGGTGEIYPAAVPQLLYTQFFAAYTLHMTFLSQTLHGPMQSYKGGSDPIQHPIFPDSPSVNKSIKDLEPTPRITNNARRRHAEQQQQQQ